MSNHNDFTVSEQRGSFRLKVFLATPNAEPIPHTVQRAIVDMQTNAQLPGISITDIHASSAVAGVVIVDVSYVVE